MIRKRLNCGSILLPVIIVLLCVAVIVSVLYFFDYIPVTKLPSEEIKNNDVEYEKNEDSSAEEVSIDEKAQQLLSNMTLEEKVGQMFIARCPEENAIEKLKKYNLGGYILFARDFSDKTKDEVTKNVQSYQKAESDQHCGDGG